MSDSLRAALEDMVLDSDGNEYEHVEGCEGEDTCPACWVKDLRFRLAAHPVEPAPGVSDEAVEAAAKAIYEHDLIPGDWPWSKLGQDQERLSRGRVALEAALPYLQAPALPRTGAELSAVSIQAHMAKRRQCPDYGIGDHDCSEHGAG